jgi:hypothetical protein
MSATAPQAYARPLPKPSSVILRRPLQAYFKKHLAIAFAVGVISACTYKFFISDPRKRAYKNFYQ